MAVVLGARFPGSANDEVRTSGSQDGVSRKACASNYGALG